MKDITNNLQPARDYLTSHYAQGITITGNILVGEDATTAYYRSPRNGPINPAADDLGANALIGTDQNDLIFGESGTDTLRGGGGADVLYGGADKSAISASVHCGPRLRPSGDDAVLRWNETAKSYRRRNTSISMFPLAA